MFIKKIIDLCTTYWHLVTLQASEMENTGSSRGQDNSYRGRGPNITRHNYG